MLRRLVSPLVALCLATPLLRAQTALSVNPAVREEVRQFYRTVYRASEDVPMGWTGSYATGAAGDTSAAFKEAVRLRLNFYRALVGVPADLALNATYNFKAQRAAMMMSGNDTLQHDNIPTTWTYYRAEGAEAAMRSNLALGTAGSAAIDGYMSDAGEPNAGVGHRRWILYPQTLLMGTGDVPGDSTREAANALWVLDAQFNGPRPATRRTEVAYPPSGYVPYALVWPRWSFSYPGADFSLAAVTMSRNGRSINARLEPLDTRNVGEPTLVWVYDDQDTESDQPHPRPTSDTTYVVNISNVRINGRLENFSYPVIVFDPEAPGATGSPATITGPATANVGAGNSYTVALPSFANGLDWRTVQAGTATAAAFTGDTGLEGVLATTSTGYQVVQSAFVAAGAGAYRLAHPERTDQVLRLPGSYLIEAAGALSFQSRLGIATPGQLARVQVSGDDGATWTTVYQQAGTTGAVAQPTERAFVRRDISLATYAGRTLAFRFVFSIDALASAFVPDATNEVGWFIDSVALANVKSVAASVPTRVASGSTFSFNPTQAGATLLQARGLMFGHGMEWGSIYEVNAVGSGTPVTPASGSYLANLSVRTTAGIGAETLIVGFTVSGGSKPLLIRGIGPTLSLFNVPNVVTDPKLEVFQGTGKVTENDNWLTADAPVFQAVGAFGLLDDSRDAAVFTQLGANGYTARVSSVTNISGAALVELYDVGGTASGGKLTNLSARSNVGAGGDVLIVGFNVAGTGTRTLLIRGVGPALAGFGVDGALSNPKLELYDGARRLVQSNDNWDAGLRTTFEQVGAFPFAPGSNDAALRVTLPPGSYTAQLSGVNGASGVALVELYDVP